MSRALLVLALLAGAGCAQTVTVKAPPGSRLAVSGEAPVVVPDSGEVEARVPVSYADPDFALTDAQGGALDAGHLERDHVNPWWATPVVGATVCAALPLAGVGFCVANPGLPIALCLSGVNDQLLASAVATVASTADSPSWATIPAVILCAGSAGVCLALMPLTLRVADEIELGEDVGIPPEPHAEAMRW